MTSSIILFIDQLNNCRDQKEGDSILYFLSMLPIRALHGELLSAIDSLERLGCNIGTAKKHVLEQREIANEKGIDWKVEEEYYARLRQITNYDED